MKKFKIVTIGCRANQYEAQAYSDQLKELGLTVSNNDLDLCIINACSVTKNADKTTFNFIKQLKEKHSKAKIYLTGCVSKDNLSKILPGIHFISNLEKQDLIKNIFPDKKVPDFKIKNFDNRTRAFIKIQDGCNSFCSYCIIPFTRGRSRSRDSTDIIDEIKGIRDNGFKEIILTAINIGDFKSDISLSELLYEIAGISGIERIRLSSIDPHHIDNDLIEIYRNVEKMMPSMHLVLQSGSDKILKEMNRKYDTKFFLEKVLKLKEVNENFTFSSDIIVGFPSESDEDFKKSIEIVENVKFIKAHIFPYSNRPNTLASKLKDQINDKTIFERKNKLIEIADRNMQIALDFFINKEMNVLFENYKDGYLMGHIENNILVKVKSTNKKNLNNIVKVFLKENKGSYFIGEICK